MTPCTIASNTGPKTLWENIDAFGHAVDWSERWIQGLVAFHIGLWVVALATRRRFWPQTTIFFIICALVFAAERLNSYAHMHWQRFAKQDYFDTHGVFTVTMYAAPLLLLAFAQMVRPRTRLSHASHIIRAHQNPPGFGQVNFVLMSSTLLVQAKRAELRSSQNRADKKRD